MFTKLTVEAEPLGQLPSRLTTRRNGPAARTGRSRARQGAGPPHDFFSLPKRLTEENYQTKPISI